MNKSNRSWLGYKLLVIVLAIIYAPVAVILALTVRKCLEQQKLGEAIFFGLFLLFGLTCYLIFGLPVFFNRPVALILKEISQKNVRLVRRVGYLLGSAACGGVIYLLWLVEKWTRLPSQPLWAYLLGAVATIFACFAAVGGLFLLRIALRRQAT